MTLVVVPRREHYENALSDRFFQSGYEVAVHVI
jgi:hypothetical protein